MIWLYANFQILLLPASPSGVGLGGAAWRGVPEQTHRCGEVLAPGAGAAEAARRLPAGGAGKTQRHSV